MNNILVTGATGFVGQSLCSLLIAKGFVVNGAVLPTSGPVRTIAGAIPVTVESMGPHTTWDHALADIDTVIHLAARVHVMDDPSANPLAEFRHVNVEGTVRLAREAARAGVRRLVFISSIKVNGEETVTPYTLESPPNCSDPYGISKWEAEQALRKIEAETGLEVVVVRPALVYGPGVKANFLKMMNIIRCGVPLPLASIRNNRSLIYVGNLVDALMICATHPAAAGQTYLVSDGEDVPTPELIRRAAKALGVPVRLLPFPLQLLLLLGKLTGRSGAVNRLTGSLTVDSSKIRKELGWTPPFTMEQGLANTAQWFKQKLSHS